jgi:hypothetical protein
MIKRDFNTGKAPINFENAHFYVDDYMTAKKLKQPLKNDFKDPEKAQNLMMQYQADYLYEGKLGGN